MRLGQTFHGYASMVSRDIRRLTEVSKEMYTVNLGGTAIGSSINVSPAYLHNVVPCLSSITGYPLIQAEDLFDATENLDGFVSVSGAVKACAVDLSKMCNDLRLLSSGPRTGLGEIHLPAMQNGSSIMPGKGESGHSGSRYPGCLSHCRTRYDDYHGSRSRADGIKRI